MNPQVTWASIPVPPGRIKGLSSLLPSTLNYYLNGQECSVIPGRPIPPTSTEWIFLPYYQRKHKLENYVCV